jgi:hypothetical protein
MSEAKALILMFIGLATLFSATNVVILVTDAGAAVLGLGLVVFAGLGGYLSSLIVMHYDRLEERKKREELILSR